MRAPAARICDLVGCPAAKTADANLHHVCHPRHLGGAAHRAAIAVRVALDDVAPVGMPIHLDNGQWTAALIGA